MKIPQAMASTRRVSSRRSVPPTLRMGAAASPQATATPQPIRWPCGPDRRPELVVMQGDLTEARVDAIVNPTNSELVQSGTLAAAIVIKGGPQIEGDCEAWIKRHGELPVGQAMATIAGSLPCRYVIHVVGPCVEFGRVTNPGSDQALLRRSVRSALCEADRLKLTSIAMPVISSGHFGFPVAVATMEIADECVCYVREKASETTLRSIVFMGGDAATFHSFASALQVAGASSEDVDEADGVAVNPEEQLAGDSCDGQGDIALTKVEHLSSTRPLSPPTPFELLSPHDAEYVRIVAELPRTIVGRVVSVRRVRVPARSMAYETTKRDLQEGGFYEVEPLYHGTPDRWRASAIALYGFDLGHRLHGRSYGEGVYTSKNVDDAYGYTRASGSLLRLRGLVSLKSTSPTLQAAFLGVHVFPNPKALLPHVIIDFGPEDL